MSSEVNSKIQEEFSNLLEQWQKEHEDPGYDPIPAFTSCSKILESGLTEFHKGDPDPFDQRHPKHVIPDCLFGELLAKFENCNGLSDKMAFTYMKTNQSPKNVEPIVIATARLALVASEGYRILALDTDEWMKVLTSWTIDADEPLRTYATGLLNGTYVIQKATNSESIRIISTLLKRLWNYVEPNKYSEPECIVSLDKLDAAASYKRKRSTETSVHSCKKLRVETSGTSAIVNDATETIYENDMSNSSWAEQMPVMLGVNYSLEPPLAASLRQSYIFDLLKCFGEFQDFLSTFLKWNTLELINKLLKNKSEGQLTFKVLEFLSSLLCHNKVATNFIELDGIQTLLRIPRPSMGSTGVALCLYNLAYKKDAMERVCHPPAQILKEIVKYAIWLLECSHESGRSHIALFFSMTLSYKNVLNLFDNMNGLRCLVNMVSTAKPITRSTDDDYDPVDDDELLYITSQIIRAVCLALRKYFEAHVIFKVSHAVKSNPALKQKYLSLDSTAKYESSAHSREQYFEYFDVLRNLAEGSSSFNLDCWSPIALFHRLEGIPLMLKIIHMAYEVDAVSSQVDVVRAALDVLCVVTLSRPCQMVLSKRYRNLGVKDIGLLVILDYISLEGYYDGQHNDSIALNSALAIIANCTDGPCSKSVDDVDVATLHGTPRYRKKRKSKETLCKLLQQNNGIKMLLSLLETTEPAQTADETRYFACRALVGLSDYKPVRQILSKLQVFVSGKLFTIFKEPVLKDNKHLHSKLCEDTEILLKKVTGKTITLDGDLKTAHRTNIVSETRVQYNNKDVLLMIYNHLMWSKLYNVADKLAQETGLVVDQDDCPLLTPVVKKNAFSRNSMGGGDGTPKQAKITFSRGNRALAETPTSASVIYTRTPSSQRRLKRTDMSSIGKCTKRQDRFTLSGNGFVTVDPRPNRIPRSASPVSLNSIIEQYFKNQHSKCRNPVVTVPQFSLFTPHHCPDRRNKVEAANNVTNRLYYRQGICPKWGGVGGVDRDLRLIYGRYKPAGTIKCNEDRKARFTSIAFLPNTDCRLILGDSAGNIQMSDIYSYEDRVIQSVSDSGIIHLEPSIAGDVMLTISPTYWSSHCSLVTLNDQLDQKLSFDDIYYVEFAKVVQDKIVGTRDSKAMIFDANTGTILSSYEKPEITCNYKNNCATFSYDDKLILNDGLLWDVRKSQDSPVHKFDKFNTTTSGVFHPNGLEVLINTEVWDMRNYSLLQTIPAFDQCQLLFNHSRSVIYCMKIDDEDASRHGRGLSSSFQTFDSSSYNQLGFISVKQQVYALALDDWDRNIAIIETPSLDESSMHVCRLYEVGMSRDDDDEEEDNGDSSYEGGSSDGDDDDDSSHVDDENFSFGEGSSFGSLSEIESEDSIDRMINDSGSGSGWETMDDD